jgi:glycerophosphoryl diester phosphodiesterase
MPENTLPAFEMALELGVTTLELDVVLSAEMNLIVSHEPWINHELCSMPDGELILKEDSRMHNIFLMSDHEVQTYPCGSIPHPQFPEQKQLASFKPTLAETVAFAAKYCEERGRTMPEFNIEVKSRPDWDGIFHPAPDQYTTAIIESLGKMTAIGEMTLQSFDSRILNALNEKANELKLVFLADEPASSVGDYLKDLNFEPFGISPHYSLITPNLVSSCKDRMLALSTWTVNEVSDMNKLLDLGVRNLISDYPDRGRKVIEERGMAVSAS